jgi:hypothetical protein
MLQCTVLQTPRAENSPCGSPMIQMRRPSRRWSSTCTTTLQQCLTCSSWTRFRLTTSRQVSVLKCRPFSNPAQSARELRRRWIALAHSPCSPEATRVLDGMQMGFWSGVDILRCPPDLPVGYAMLLRPKRCRCSSRRSFRSSDAEVLEHHVRRVVCKGCCKDAEAWLGEHRHRLEECSSWCPAQWKQVRAAAQPSWFDSLFGRKRPNAGSSGIAGP